MSNNDAISHLLNAEYRTPLDIHNNCYIITTTGTKEVAICRAEENEKGRKLRNIS